MRNGRSSSVLIIILTLATAPGVHAAGVKHEKTWLDDLADYMEWGGGGGGGEKPHVLYVVMDDQGYGDVGYTYPDTADVRTPLLDKLASEGKHEDMFCAI